jgi:hypothetical protein
MSLTRFIYLIGCACTSVIGYAIHKSIIWAIVDFLFTPLVWIKWIICHDVTLSIIKGAFAWFFQY